MIREAGGEPRCPGNEEGTRVGRSDMCKCLLGRGSEWCEVEY